MIEANIDDWIVINDGFSEPLYRTLRVIKSTPQKVVAVDAGRAQGRHIYKDNLHHVGSEAACRSIVEALTSSVGLMRDEHRRSRQRHTERVAKILSAASS